MSTISNRHLFTEFVSGESKPFDGQRLAKVSYKNKSGKKSQCVSIPRLSDDEIAIIHLQFPVNARKRVEDFQDSLIRALYESKKSEITSEEIDVDQIAAFLSASAEGNRISAESVTEWWNSGFRDEIAMPVLSEKYGTEDSALLERKAKLWCDAFIALCGRNAITRERVNSLREMLEFADEGDSVAGKLMNKVNSLTEELDKMEDI